MSQVKIQGNASGTGIFTVAAPNSNTDRTLTLPDGAGTLDRLERAGNILQVVHLQTYGYTTNATTTFNDVPNLSLAITPSSASSKILVQINLSGCGKYSGNTWGQFRLVRNGSAIVTFCDSAGWSNSTLEINHNVGYDYLDSPATTSAVTYKVQFASGNGVSAAQVGNYVSALTNARHSIVLMEIAA